MFFSHLYGILSLLSPIVWETVKTLFMSFIEIFNFSSNVSILMYFSFSYTF